MGEDHEAIRGTTRVRKGLEPTNSNADISERIFRKRNKKSVIGQTKCIIKNFGEIGNNTKLHSYSSYCPQTTDMNILIKFSDEWDIQLGLQK